MIAVGTLLNFLPAPNPPTPPNLPNWWAQEKGAPSILGCIAQDQYETSAVVGTTFIVTSLFISVDIANKIMNFGFFFAKSR